jgi:hypothetical protein
VFIAFSDHDLLSRRFERGAWVARRSGSQVLRHADQANASNQGFRHSPQAHGKDKKIHRQKSNLSNQISTP